MSSRIADNRKAFHDYHILERFEAGLALQGWEVKALRAGRSQLAGAHVIERGGELFSIGFHITPLIQASSHTAVDPDRSRKLLLRRAEIDRIRGLIQSAGMSLVPLNLHWKQGRAKMEIALVKGKKLHDKREAIASREADREAARAVKHRASRPQERS